MPYIANLGELVLTVPERGAAKVLRDYFTGVLVV